MVSDFEDVKPHSPCLAYGEGLPRKQQQKMGDKLWRWRRSRKWGRNNGGGAPEKGGENEEQKMEEEQKMGGKQGRRRNKKWETSYI